MAWLLTALSCYAGGKVKGDEGIQRRAHPLSHSSSFAKKAPLSGGSALPTPATYSGRYAKAASGPVPGGQQNSTALRHSTGSLEAALPQPSAAHAGRAHAAQQVKRPNSARADPAGFKVPAKQAQMPNSAREHPAAAASRKTALSRAGPSQVAKQPTHAQTKPRAKPAAAPKEATAAMLPARQRLTCRLVKQAPLVTRVQPDPAAAKDLASKPVGSSEPEVGSVSPVWSSQSPHGQLSMLESMLQALPQRDRSLQNRLPVRFLQWGKPLFCVSSMQLPRGCKPPMHICSGTLTKAEYEQQRFSLPGS